jgi:hypothetical protein
MESPETNPNVFTQDRIWQVALAALTTVNDKELSTALGISENKLKEWKGEHPSFYRAIVAARTSANSSGGSGGIIAKHIGNSLPGDLKELWDELSGDNLTDRETVMYNLATRGDFDKQRLLVHALSVTRFDLNKCCQMLDISKSQLDQWSKNDPRFAKLWAEVHFQKQNFLESALMKKIASGDTKSIIFANERINRDRGYGQHIEVSGRVEHVHAHIDVSQLDLDTDTKSKILLACKQAGLLDMDGMLIEGQVIQKDSETTALLPESR